MNFMFKKLLSLIAIFALTITHCSWSGQANLVLIKNESNESVVIQSNAGNWANTTTDEAGNVYNHEDKPFSIAPGATLKCSNFIIPWNSYGQSIFVNIAGKQYDIHDINNLNEQNWDNTVFIIRSIRVIEKFKVIEKTKEIEKSKIWDFVISCKKRDENLCKERTEKYDKNMLNVAIIIKGNTNKIIDSMRSTSLSYGPDSLYATKRFIEIREVKSDGTIDSTQPGLQPKWSTLPDYLLLDIGRGKEEWVAPWGKIYEGERVFVP